MEKSEIGTLKETLVSKTNTPSSNYPLRSRTVDTLLHILSICYTDSSHIIQNSDKSIENVPSDCNDIIPNDLLLEEPIPTNKHMEPAQHYHNLLEEKKDLSQNVNIIPSVNTDIQNQDSYDKDVEELEILEDLTSSMPESNTKSVEMTDSEPKDCSNTKPGLEEDNNSILLFTDSVKNSVKDMAGVVNKTTRNLVSYSEIEFDSERVLAVQNNSKPNAPNNRKRPESCTKEGKTNKKSKKSVGMSTCPEKEALVPEKQASAGEQNATASQEVVDASAINVAGGEKKRKRVVNKERKARKKMKERMKRAEEDRKLGIKRLKLQPVVKEKKISYCRHYMNGRCHEGEKCKFSHDTTPLTKSKPCRHFARNACMKGDDCPYDHVLSKYPCNNYQTKGSCNRGSACMFSHEGQPSEAPANVSKPEQTLASDSGSQNVDTKSCMLPKVVDITPKPAQPPKGINFLSQEKLVPESHEVMKITKTPLVQDLKEITKTPLVVQDSEGVTKTPPRGINFLSFGGLVNTSGGSRFKISDKIGKSELSDVEGKGLKSKSMVNEVKVEDSSRKPMHIMSFMSSTSQKALHSTLDFASKFNSGVKSKV